MAFFLKKNHYKVSLTEIKFHFPMGRNELKLRSNPYHKMG